MTKTARLTERDLSQFTGSENWCRHDINRNRALRHGATIEVAPSISGRDRVWLHWGGQPLLIHSSEMFLLL
jgi:hypothetical protein